KTDSYMIQDKDNISIKQLQTIRDFFTSIHMDDLTETSPFIIQVNNEVVHLPKGQTKILVNEQEVNSDYVLKDGDTIALVSAVSPTVKDVITMLDKTYWNTIEIYFNSQKVNMKQQQLSIHLD